MKPFILLISAFCIACLICKLSIGDYNIIFAGNLAMCLMLCFTGMGHFMFSKGMALMLPEVIPFRVSLVYLTGIMEILLGIALLYAPFRVCAGIITISFFILLLPANIYAAVKKLDYEKGTYNGPGLMYLWFRVPLQLFFIAWVYYFAVR